MVRRAQVTAFERGGRYEKHAISRYDDNKTQKVVSKTDKESQILGGTGGCTVRANRKGPGASGPGRVHPQELRGSISFS